MSNSKVVMSQAANTLTTPLNVEDVFSTYLYQGNGSTQTITNGIDLEGEGGLTWIKSRGDNNAGAENHQLFDTERGANKVLQSNSTLAEATYTQRLTSFNSDGFSVGSDYDVNNPFPTFASWTFRKAPKFFDVVTYTGDGVAGRTVSHNLGSVPGCIIVKRLDLGSSWCVYHQGQNGGVNPEQYRILLNTADPEVDDVGSWNDTAPTDSVFSVGTTGNVNSSGGTYVAYLFAHNEGDGGFNGGDIIKCGSFDGASNTEVDLGFEPQWILWKSSNGAFNWGMVDNMRGIPSGGNDAQLLPNGSEAEAANENVFDLNPTGFTWKPNASGNNYIYIAIRRGTKVPESATEVFAVDTKSYSTNEVVNTGFPVDMLLMTGRTIAYGNDALDRIRGLASTNTTPTNPRLRTNENSSEANSDYVNTFNNTGYQVSAGFTGFSSVNWNWKRAPNFFDVVAYTGDGVAGRTVSHNLGVAPEMMWVKRRDSAANWYVYQQYMDPSPADRFIWLNLTDPKQNFNTALVWNNTLPTVTDFSLGSGAGTNGSGGTYIAYLFASLPGISKVGSYTGNGTSQTIDCGFTSGARFILVKRTDSFDDWYVWDTERGIVTGNDPYLELNTADAEVTSTDWIDPDNSGFIVNGTTINASSAEYIFYAIA